MHMHPKCRSSDVLSNLSALIPLGVLELDVEGLPGPPPRASDGWLWAPPLPWLRGRKGIERELVYLSLHGFIRATYCMHCSGRALIRVYGVPEDIDCTLLRDHVIESKGRKMLSRIMKILHPGVEEWNGIKNLEPFQAASSRVVTNASIDIDLSTLFADLPSPKINLTGGWHSALLIDAFEGTVPLLQSTLYPYQCRSLCKMLEMELIPSSFVDPKVTAKTDALGETYYLNVHDTLLWKKPLSFQSAKGGMLCEDMGTGKTCICLALILASITQTSNAPPGFLATSSLYDHIGSLSDYCIQSISHNGVYWRDLEGRIGALDKIRKFPAFYEIITSNPSIQRTRHSSGNGNNMDVKVMRRQRRESAENRLRIYLCTTTLLIVPNTLVDQWLSEIEKHVRPGSLRVLCISTSQESLPDPSELIAYDLVILSQSRFSKEDNEGSSIHSGIPAKCQCPYIGATRKRKCYCNASKAAFEMLKPNSPLLQVHWKRVIVDEGHSLAGNSTRLIRLARDLRAERRWCVTGTVTNTFANTTLNIKPRKRGHSLIKEEVSDLEKLRDIVLNFIQLEPFTPQLWRQAVINPFLRSETSILKQILSLIVRHRPEDVARGYALPPLSSKIVRLKPSQYNRLSINIIASLIASNAVQSQRVDQDYMFHTSQRKALSETVGNLILSTFHWTGTSLQDVDKALESSREALQKADKRNYSFEDCATLRKVIVCLEKAKSSPEWRTLAVKPNDTNHEMGTEAIVNQWALHDPHTGLANLFSGASLLSLQKCVFQNMWMEESALLSFLEVPQPEKPLNRPTASKDGGDTLKKMIEHEKSNIEDEGTFSFSRNRTISQDSVVADLIRFPDAKLPSALSGMCIRGTTSAKLNYLLTEILKYYGEEKIIVFAESNAIIWYVAEALEILGVEHLIYVPQLRKSYYIVDFDSSPKYRVLIMDLKVAAHGLNITAASRVYFMSAVWNAAIEAQAIKRAHRIGQTRPVYVETLILEGTIEEEIAARRNDLNHQGESISKQLTDDSKLRQIISASTFAEWEGETSFAQARPLFRTASPDSKRAADAVESISKKRKIVTFA